MSSTKVVLAVVSDLQELKGVWGWTQNVQVQLLEPIIEAEMMILVKVVMVAERCIEGILA